MLDARTRDGNSKWTLSGQIAENPNKMSRILAFLTVCCVVLCSPTTAQNPAMLTLDDCIQKALAAPSALSVARLDRQIADRDKSIARAGLLPQVLVGVGGIYTSPSQLNPDTFAFIPANAIREYTGLARLQMEIDTSGRIRAEIARARANQQVSQASVGIAQRDLKRAVSQAYYRLLLARRLVGVVNSSLAESQNFEQRVHQRLSLPSQISAWR